MTRPRHILSLCFATAFVVSSWIPDAGARTNSQLCHRAIGKKSLRVLNSYFDQVDRCIKFGDYDNDCIRDLPTKQSINDVISGGRCEIALQVEGVPVSEFGPPKCPKLWDDCHDIQSVNSIPQDSNDLTQCLSCSLRSYHEKFLLELDLPAIAPAEVNERKCVRAVVRQTAKTIQKGLGLTMKCIQRSSLAKPFACPVDDSPDSKFAKLLGKLGKRVGRCRDASGVQGALSGDSATLCAPDAETPAALTACAQRVARCLVCRHADETFGQSQNCVAFSGDPNCRTSAPPAGAIYVANGDDDTVTYLAPDGSYAAGALPASTHAVGGNPVAITADARTNTLWLVNGDDGTVTMLDAETGEPITGSLATSTVAVGVGPLAIAVDTASWHAYVVNGGDESLTILNSRDGSYLNGTLVGSTFATGADPRDVAVLDLPNDEANWAVVANRGDDTLTVFDAGSGNYAFSSLAASSVPARPGPAGLLAIDGELDDLYVANEDDDSVSLFSVSVGLPRMLEPTFGTLADSTVAVGDGPVSFGLRDEFGQLDVVFVANAGDQTVTLLDTDLGYTWLTQARSTASVGLGLRDILYSTESQRLYLTSSGNSVDRLGDPWASPGFMFRAPDICDQMTVDTTRSRLHATTMTFNQNDGYYAFEAMVGQTTGTDVLESDRGFGQQLAYDPASDRVYQAWFSNFVWHDASAPVLHAGLTLIGFCRPSPGSMEVYGFAVDPVLERAYVGYAITDGFDQARVATCDTSDGSIVAFFNPGFDPPTMDAPREVFIAADTALGIVYAVFGTKDKLVYLDAATLDYLTGSAATSTFDTGAGGLRVAANPSAGLVYVTNLDDDTVTYFDGATGAYLGSSLAAASFATGPDPGPMAVDESAGILYVANEGDSTVTFLDAVTGAYVFGTQATSTFSTNGLPPEARTLSLSLDTAQGVLFIGQSDHITALDAASGLPADVSVAPLDSVAVGNSPTAMVRMP